MSYFHSSMQIDFKKGTANFVDIFKYGLMNPVGCHVLFRSKFFKRKYGGCNNLIVGNIIIIIPVNRGLMQFYYDNNWILRKRVVIIVARYPNWNVFQKIVWNLHLPNSSPFSHTKNLCTSLNKITIYVGWKFNNKKYFHHK